MKFFEGMVVGSLLTFGASLMCSEMFPKNDAKKMMKKGKQFVKKMGLV